MSDAAPLLEMCGIVKSFPGVQPLRGVDPDNVRQTLILLEKPPLERRRRSLIRGRAAALRRNSRD